MRVAAMMVKLGRNLFFSVWRGAACFTCPPPPPQEEEGSCSGVACSELCNQTLSQSNAALNYSEYPQPIRACYGRAGLKLRICSSFREPILACPVLGTDGDGSVFLTLSPMQPHRTQAELWVTQSCDGC
ncbi:unnamed protein product [Natator depressus]